MSARRLRADKYEEDRMFEKLQKLLKRKLIKRFPGLKDAATTRNVDAVKSTAHWLKGSAATVQLHELADIGKKMELAATDEAFERMDQLIVQTEQLISEWST